MINYWVKLFSFLLLSLVLFSNISFVSYAWNPNPVYNPFEIVWNAINDLFLTTDDLQNQIDVISVEEFNESDPQVGTLNSGKWCLSDGVSVQCTQNVPVTLESDPQVVEH